MDPWARRGHRLRGAGAPPSLPALPADPAPTPPRAAGHPALRGNAPATRPYEGRAAAVPPVSAAAAPGVAAAGRPAPGRHRRPLPPPPAPARSSAGIAGRRRSPRHPGREAPRGYVPVPVRRRRRWPWVLLLSLVCCCGCPAWFGKPMWEQYPADAALPGQVADLTLRQDSRQPGHRQAAQGRGTRGETALEDVFAGVYGTGDGKRVTVFGGTGFRFGPESDADDEMTPAGPRPTGSTPQAVETRVRGRYERCATGRSDGTDVVVCTSVDYGGITTAVFTRLSVDDIAAPAGHPAGTDRHAGAGAALRFPDRVRRGCRRRRGAAAAAGHVLLAGELLDLAISSSVIAPQRGPVVGPAGEVQRLAEPYGDLRAAGRGTRRPIGWALSVPIMPTGMIGTPAATASRTAPVRPW